MTVTISSHDIANPEVIHVAVARTPGGPTTDTLLICTGIAVCNFVGSGDIRRDTLEFPVPGEDGNPLNVTAIVPGGSILHLAATASLASINGGNTLAVDAVDLRLSDPEEGLLFLEVNLAASGGNTVNRVAYQVNIIVGPPSPPIG
jgi:hypothetical protein